MMWTGWTSICSCRKMKPFIEYPGYGRLFVLPYIRSRLVFAQLAARALEEERFDQVLVDLPYFLNNGSTLESALGHFPLVSILILKRNDSSHVFFPFVPSDAGCISARIAMERSIPFECIDDSRLPYFPEGSMFRPSVTGLPDDYLVFDMGLKEYFAPFWSHLDYLWEKASHIERYFTSLRIAVLGERLKKALSQGEKVLFVCETSLWQAIKRWLDGESTPPNPIHINCKDLQGALVFESPLNLWSRGLLDDYPLLVFKFWKSLEDKEGSSFDKLDAFKRVMEELLQPESLTKAGNPSIRLLIIFKQYLKTQMVSHKRVIPHPTDHLFESAKSCMGMDMATHIARRFLYYFSPLDFIISMSQYPLFLVRQDEIVPSEGASELPDLTDARYYYFFDISSGPYHFKPGHPEENLVYWKNVILPSMTRKELVELNRNGGECTIRWTVAQDYGLHARVCSYVKEKVTRAAATVRIRRSWGQMMDGIHWKATLCALARGEKAVYVKERAGRKAGFPRMNDFTPVVFLFSREADRSYSCVIHDSNEKLRNMELDGYYPNSDTYPQGDLDMVYSVFYTISSNRTFWSPHFAREHLTSIAMLCTIRAMGSERYQAITRRPKRYQCRIHPRDDKELQDFSLLEKGVAWAVKYAEDVVVVVHYPGWSPSARLLSFARKKGVMLECISMSCLSKRLVRRLRHLHFVSTALKRHPEYERIVRRFLHLV